MKQCNPRRAAADAAVVLAGTAQGLVAGEVDESLWQSTAAAATAVADQLTRRPARPCRPPSATTSPHPGNRPRLEKPFTLADVQARVAAAKAGAAGVAEYRALRALLRGPLPAAPLRKDVTAEATRLSRRLYDAVAALDAAGDDAGRAPPAPPHIPVVAEADRATRRVRVSLALLRLDRPGLRGPPGRGAAGRRRRHGLGGGGDGVARCLGETTTGPICGPGREGGLAGRGPAQPRPATSGRWANPAH